MSLKSVDMSMAVHKNSELSQLQRELQHKPAVDQTILADTGAKTAEATRQRPAKMEESAKSRIRDRQEGKKDGNRGEAAGDGDSAKQASKVDKAVAADHPFKGHYIDLSL